MFVGLILRTLEAGFAIFSRRFSGCSISTAGLLGGKTTAGALRLEGSPREYQVLAAERTAVQTWLKSPQPAQATGEEEQVVRLEDLEADVDQESTGRWR